MKLIQTLVAMFSPQNHHALAGRQLREAQIELLNAEAAAESHLAQSMWHTEHARMLRSRITRLEGNNQ